MKRIAITALAILMLLSMSVGALAVPSNVAYQSTRSFLEVCDQEGLKYTYNGVDNDNDETVLLDYSLDNTSITVRVFFEDEASCGIRVWYLITYDPSRLGEIVEACNNLNNQYRWVKFYADTSDNTVTASADVEFGDNPAGNVVRTMLRRVVNITNLGYNELMQYNVG